MVNIEVKDGNKYAGVSAFVSFPYNIRYVDLMRKQPCRYWHADLRCWEIPYSDINPVLEALGTDYKLKIDESLQQTQIEESKVEIPSSYKFKTSPYAHQIEGVLYGLNHKKFLLGDEQGLGKTKQMLDLAIINKQLYGYKHCFIIACVNGLKYNWQEEVKIHTDEQAYILGTRINKKGKITIGSNKDRLDDLKNIDQIDAYFIITNIETLRYVVKEQVPTKTKNKNGTIRYKKITRFPIVEELQKLIKEKEISMIVADEVHKCLAGNTPVLTNNGVLPIKDIIQHQNPKIKVATFTKNRELKYVTPTGYFINPIAKTMLQLDIETTTGVKTVVCTHNHKFLTKNRGYVEACNLTCDDVLEEFTNE